ncbi:MAG: PIN domain-containing protein, partial [ANME-2 cluster archaeon]|nr:PIN domain-containing protein [ANME-2 cluster archaeon]
DSCRVVHIDKDLLIESLDVFLKYDGTLPLADASSIVIMNNMKISEIVSFDSDFDKVDNLNRIHKLDS